MEESKTLILGSMRSGKDTVAEWLRDNRELSFESSSYFAVKTFIFDKMIADGYHYDSIEDCFADRVNHREYWYKAIKKYNTPHLDRLVKEVLVSNDAYVGLRDIDEFLTCMGYDLPKWWQFWKTPIQVRKPLFDRIIWVDASRRKPIESKKSMNINVSDIIGHGVPVIYIYNNATIEKLHKQLENL